MASGTLPKPTGHVSNHASTAIVLKPDEIVPFDIKRVVDNDSPEPDHLDE